MFSTSSLFLVTSFCKLAMDFWLRLIGPTKCLLRKWNRDEIILVSSVLRLYSWTLTSGSTQITRRAAPAQLGS